MTKKINTGIIGYGMASKVFHLPLLMENKNFEVSTIVSSRPEDVLKDYPEVNVIDSVEALLKIREIDLVINTSPNQFHYQFAKETILAGKSIINEKPFVVNSNQGKELIELAKKKSVLLSVFHNRRLDGDFLTIKKLFSNQVLGTIKEFKFSWNRYRPEIRDRWREKDLPGSGILFDLGAHMFDQIIELFGMPKALFADIQSQKRGTPPDDYFHIILHYPNELRVILHSSSFSDISPRYEIYGTKGNYIKYGVDEQENKLKMNKHLSRESLMTTNHQLDGTLFKYDSNQINEEVIKGTSGNYPKFYDDIFESIYKKKDVSVSPESANQVIYLIEKSFESAEKGLLLELESSSN